MKKEIVEIIEEFKDNYCEKHYHKYSPFTKFIVDECIKTAEGDCIDDDFIDEDYDNYDEIDPNPIALFWIFYRAKEEGFTIDYMNDTMSFMRDPKILTVTARFGMGFKKYYTDKEIKLGFLDTPRYIDKMAKDMVQDLDQQAIDFIDAICHEYGYSNKYKHIFTKSYYRFNPICKLMISINNWIGHNPSDYEIGGEYVIKLIYDPTDYDRQYDIFQHNIVNGLEKPYSLNRVKVGRIYKILYRLAAFFNEYEFLEWCRDGKRLPKFIEESLYSLLINSSPEFNHDEIYMAFVECDVDKIENRILYEFEHPGSIIIKQRCEEIIDNLFNKYTAIQL